MKLTCPVVEDLLPFYHDNTCSAESQRLIEEHLICCAHCRHTLAELQEIIPYGKKTAKRKDVPSVQKTMQNKQRNTLFNGIIFGALLAATIFVGYIFLHETVYVPFSPEYYEILDLSQLTEHEGIAFTLSAPHPDYISSIEFRYEEDGTMYIVPQHRMFEHVGEIPADIIRISQPPYEYTIAVSSEVPAVYLGNKRNAVLIWEQGQELPIASQEMEQAAYEGWFRD